MRHLVEEDGSCNWTWSSWLKYIQEPQIPCLKNFMIALLVVDKIEIPNRVFSLSRLGVSFWSDRAHIHESSWESWGQHQRLSGSVAAFRTSKHHENWSFGAHCQNYRGGGGWLISKSIRNRISILLVALKLCKTFRMSSQTIANERHYVLMICGDFVYDPKRAN